MMKCESCNCKMAVIPSHLNNTGYDIKICPNNCGGNANGLWGTVWSCETCREEHDCFFHDDGLEHCSAWSAKEPTP